MARPPEKRTQGRPSLEVRQEIEVSIARAALAVFRSYPAQEATIERIAATAGVTKAAIYRRFPDRSALLSAAMAPVVQSWLDELTAIIAGQTNPLEALRLSFKAMAEEIPQGDRDLWCLMMSAGPHDRPFMLNIKRWRRAFEDLFDRLVADAIAQKQILDADPAILREMLFYLLVEGPTHRALTARWAGKKGDDGGAASFEDRWAFALRGLTPR